MNILFYSVLLIILNKVLPEEIIFLFCFAIVIVFSVINLDYMISGIRAIKMLLFIVIVGCITGLDNSMRDYVRDLFYVSQIIVYFLFGLVAIKYIKNIIEFKKIIITFGVVCAVLHVIIFFTTSSILNLNIDEIRNIAGQDSDFELLSFCTLILSFINSDIRKLLLIRRNGIYWIIFFIQFVSFSLYFSRTMILSSIVIIFIVLNKFEVFKNGKLIAFVVSFVFLIVFIDYIPEINNIELFKKFSNIKGEIFSTNIVSFSEEDINKNWRSYETYRGMLLFNAGSVIQMIFGHGFGTLVDLGISIKLGENEFERIPIFHNGYIYFLVKLGVVGVLTYSYFIYKVGFNNKKTFIGDLKLNAYVSGMLQALSIVVLLNTFTISGLINKQAFFLTIVLGYLWKFNNYRFVKLKQVLLNNG
jgi:hypothetical protein